MISIEFSNKANNQLDEIVSNDDIYDRYGHFTQQFLNWNTEFHRYVNPQVLSKTITSDKGIYSIGKIGTFSYKLFILNDTQVLEIMDFHFTRLPYTTGSKYKVIANAGYGYKIVQSTFNNLYAILTPQRRLLTKYVFEEIIGFHHSSNDYNIVYAVGFIGDRVYSICTNGNINMMPYSKKEYLEMNHKYYENRIFKSPLINENTIRRIVTDVISNRFPLR